MAADKSDVSDLLRRLELAEARADAERARADAAEKKAFVAKLDGIAASGSESSPADVERRGAPAPVIADEGAVALGMPALEEAEARASWARYVAAHAPAPAAPGAPRAVAEVRAVQPVVKRLSLCAAGAEAVQLRIWLGKEASDDNAAAAAIPDQVWTHARDAASSLIGALVIVEVKKPGHLNSAIAQAAKYLRRRVAALFHEADARGESGHGIFSVAAATDGHYLALLRMASGAPKNGDFRDACPCPVLVTKPLELLPGFSFAAEDAQAPPRDPPPGFLALARVLRAPLAALGSAQPLSELHVTLADGAAATLRFGARLGSGGTSDVYARAFFDPKQAKETDTHYRCTNSAASFNYRLLYNVKYPSRDATAYRMTVQLYDRDFFKSNDMIGEAVLDLKNNQLNQIYGFYFEKLLSLTLLDLSKNSIEFIDLNSFIDFWI
jgi:hypothetical protein